MQTAKYAKYAKRKKPDGTLSYRGIHGLHGSKEADLTGDRGGRREGINAKRQRR